MVDKIIQDFPQQLKFQPIIVNQSKLRPFSKVVIIGMGGSALAGDLLKKILPNLDLIVHRSYGLPFIGEGEAKNYLVIASSYSGNTEEVIDSFKIALSKNFNLAAISLGGALLKLAEEHNVPYVKIPDTDIEPRFALGFGLRSILKVMGETQALEISERVADAIDMEKCEKEGLALANALKNRIPLVYSSLPNESLAYNWKIKFNETTKIPAFYNVLPEMNHNEMTGFDIVESTKELSSYFKFIFLEDGDDDKHIQKRMMVTKNLFEERDFKVIILKLEGSNVWEKIFSSLLIADWASFYLAEHYGVDSKNVPMVEEFKKLIAS